MNVTEVKFRKLWPEGKIKAIGSLTIDNAFVVHGIKIVEGQNGIFMAMPSRRTPDGKYRDIAHPISQEVRDDIQAKAFAAYYEALAEAEREQANQIEDQPVESFLSEVRLDNIVETSDSNEPCAAF